MTNELKPRVLFVPGHMCDERLYETQVAALATDFDCQVMVFRCERSMAEIAGAIFASQPQRFHYVGLSMGGYIAFELLRQHPERLLSLALLDTKAGADEERHRAGRLADRERVERDGLDDLAAELPGRWLSPEHAADPSLSALVRAMAGSIGVAGMVAQQEVMLSRPDSSADLARVACPSLVVVGRQDQVTPIADHEAIVSGIRRHRTDCRFEILDDCGHLSTIEQPAATSKLLRDWLRA